LLVVVVVVDVVNLKAMVVVVVPVGLELAQDYLLQQVQLTQLLLVLVGMVVPRAPMLALRAQILCFPPLHLRVVVAVLQDEMLVPEHWLEGLAVAEVEEALVLPLVKKMVLLVIRHQFLRLKVITAGTDTHRARVMAPVAVAVLVPLVAAGRPPMEEAGAMVQHQLFRVHR